MKKISLMGLALLSLMAAGLSGCSSEDSLSRDNNNAAGVTIKASIDNPASRVAFKDEDSKLKTYWKDAADVEKFTLYYADAPATEYLFVKGATTDAKRASFSCSTAQAVAANTTVYAVYPGRAISAYVTTIDFSLKDQPGTEATTTSTGDVGDFNFMVASATVPEGGLSNVSFSFVHKVALVKMVLTFPADVTGNITNISINSAAMHNAGTYTLGTGAWSYTDAQEGSVSTKSDATFTLTNNKVTVWLAVFPEDLSSATDITITAKAGGFTYQAAMSGISFVASKVYSVSKTLAKVVNFRSVYTADDYKTWSTENCGEAPSKDDIEKYLGAGVYWDDGSAEPNQQTYSVTGVQYHAGLWMMKKQYIPTSTQPVGKATPLTGRPADISQYFFLPAAGLYDSSRISNVGDVCYYWSSTPDYNNLTYLLSFTNKGAEVFSDENGNRFLPLIAE